MTPTLEQFRDRCITLLRENPLRFFPLHPQIIEAVEGEPSAPGRAGIRVVTGAAGTPELVIHPENLLEACRSANDFSDDFITARLGHITLTLQEAMSVLDDWSRTAPLLQFRLAKPGLMPDAASRLRFRWGDLEVFPSVLLRSGLGSIPLRAFQSWGIPLETVIQQGIENTLLLWGHAAPTSISLGGVPTWVWAVERDVESGFALAPQMMARVPLPREEMVLAVPLQGSLMVIEKAVASRHRINLDNGVRRMFHNGPRSCSPHLYHFRGDALIRWE